MSYACGNGFLPILELLSQLEEVDPNLPDKDGNTPLIFAAQAGMTPLSTQAIGDFPYNFLKGISLITRVPNNTEGTLC